MYVHIPKQTRKKLDPKAIKCIFVGYGENIKGFRVWNPVKNTVDVSRDVVFCENVVENSIEGESSVEISDDSAANVNNNSTESASNVETTAAVDTTFVNESFDEDEFNDCSDEGNNSRRWCDVTESNILDQRLRARVNMANVCCDSSPVAFMATFDEPATYKEAIRSEEKRHWIGAMNEEFDSLVKNRTWNLVDLPAGKKLIDNRWVFKVKMNTDGSVDRYKARLVVRGFTQEYGIDYSETFIPVVKFTSIRMVLTIAAQENLKLRQFDVKTAFLYGELEEDVYMSQPIGYDDGIGKVCKLQKSLYGLKQASRCWNKKFTLFIKQFDFVVLSSDPCVFVHSKNENKIILAIYVDDGLMAASNEWCMKPVIEFLNNNFEIKDFEAKCFLGLEINQHGDGSIHIHQSAYACKVLDRFQMMSSHAVAVPADPNQILCATKAHEQSSFPYRQAIGSVMYLAIATRPDISYAVGRCSRFMENPAQIHVNAVKRILKYIRGTINSGIHYKFDRDFYLRGYSDADFAGDLDDRRSTSGYLFFLGANAISWCSAKQRTVSVSTTESEYVAASEAMKELIWLKRLLSEIAPDVKRVPSFYMDNQSAIKLVKNPELHKRTKHIDVRYHFIREKYERNEFVLEYVSSNDQLADVFTKPLARNKFEFFREKMNVNSDRK